MIHGGREVVGIRTRAIRFLTLSLTSHAAGKFHGVKRGLNAEGEM